MVKRVAAAIMAVCVAVHLAAFAQAVTFVDDFTIEVQANIRGADPTAPFLTGVRKNAPEDRDVNQMTIISGQQRGGMGYRVSGLERINLRIYSPMGTFAAVSSEGKPYFGAINHTYNPAQVLDTYFAGGRIYLSHNGNWHLLTGVGGNVDFTATPVAPAQSIRVNMGVNVYASASMHGPRTRVPVARTAIQQKRLGMDTSFADPLVVAEDYQSVAGRIPPGTRYIWVSINDPGGNLLSAEGMRTSLAWVSFSGSALLLGRPPPTTIQQPPLLSEPDPSPNNPGPGTTVRPPTPPPPPPPTPPRPPTPTPPAQPPTPAANPPRPEGSPNRVEEVITAPAARQQAPAPAQTAPVQQPVREIETPAVPLASEGLLVYDIHREVERPDSRLAVIFYIIAVGALVVYLLLRPKKKDSPV